MVSRHTLRTPQELLWEICLVKVFVVMKRDSSEMHWTTTRKQEVLNGTLISIKQMLVGPLFIVVSALISAGDLALN